MKNEVGRLGAVLGSLVFSAAVARHCTFKLFVHGSNGKVRSSIGGVTNVAENCAGIKSS